MSLGSLKKGDKVTVVEVMEETVGASASEGGGKTRLRLRILAEGTHSAGWVSSGNRRGSNQMIKLGNSDAPKLQQFKFAGGGKARIGKSAQAAAAALALAVTLSRFLWTDVVGPDSVLQVGTLICCGALWTPRCHLACHVTVL